jgi:flagellar motor switch protein FliM
MKELLTNEEIDTLLDMFRAEGAPAEQAELALASKEGKGPIVNPIDLLKPNRLSRDQMRALERLFEGMAKGMAATISEKLRTDVQCDCVAVEQIRFQGWMGLISDPAAIYVLKMPPFEPPVLFTATASLLYGAVDRILGGSGRVQRVPKDFTAAEYTVADAFVGPCLDVVCRGLEDVLALTWSVQGRFCNPSLAQILPSQDVVLSVHFQTSGDALIGDLRLVIPYTALEPHLMSLEREPGARFKKPPGGHKEALTRAVGVVPLELSVQLGEAAISLRQLLALRKGDVVPLDRRVGEPLFAPVQGRKKFSGQVGKVGNRLAFQVGSVHEG